MVMPGVRGSEPGGWLRFGGGPAAPSSATASQSVRWPLVRHSSRLLSDRHSVRPLTVLQLKFIEPEPWTQSVRPLVVWQDRLSGAAGPAKPASSRPARAGRVSRVIVASFEGAGQKSRNARG